MPFGRMRQCSLHILLRNRLRQTATDCNTLQHTATHCNTLQHTATHCSTLQHVVRSLHVMVSFGKRAEFGGPNFKRGLCLACEAVHSSLQLRHKTTHCNTLQHAATHCNTLQHAGTQACNTMQYTVRQSTHHCHPIRKEGYKKKLLCRKRPRSLNCLLCNILQHAATRCNMLQHAAARCNTLQRAARHCSALQHAATRYNMQMCCSVLQCVAVCCSVLQCVAVY